MELDSLLSSQRWKILEIVSARPSSPLEISNSLKTSIAYVSQQLKLLEAAGIVTKEKTGSSDKGKPRSVYSVSKSFLHITLISGRESKKGVLKLDDSRLATLRIWSLKNKAVSEAVERIFWKLGEDLENIEGIYLDTSAGKERLVIISDSKKVKQKESSFKEISGDNFKVSIYEKGKSPLPDVSPYHLIYKKSGGEADE